MYGVWSEKRGFGEGFYVFAVYAVQESLEETVTSAKSRPSRLKFPTSSESSRKLQEVGVEFLRLGYFCQAGLVRRHFFIWKSLI